MIEILTSTNRVILNPFFFKFSTSSTSTQQNEDTYISKNSQPAGPSKSEDIYIPDNDLFTQTEDSHFFMYFLTSASIVILGYVAFHNKNKVSPFY